MNNEWQKRDVGVGPNSQASLPPIPSPAVCTNLRPANLDQPEGICFISGNDKKVPQSAVWERGWGGEKLFGQCPKRRGTVYEGLIWSFSEHWNGLEWPKTSLSLDLVGIIYCPNPHQSILTFNDTTYKACKREPISKRKWKLILNFHEQRQQVVSVIGPCVIDHQERRFWN